MLPPRINRDAVQKSMGSYADESASLEQRAAIYEELVGMLVTGALDPKMLSLQEQMREHGMYPSCFDVKTSQLMLFGMLLMDLSDAAIMHGIAARKAGASWEEMQAVVSLCFLFRGLSAANRGAEVLANICDRESKATS